MKRVFIIVLYLFIILGIADISYASSPRIPIFDIDVHSNVTDSYDYQYTLSYPNYAPLIFNMKGISHWWLEINCAHSSIDRDSIYGYSILNDVQYDWMMEFAQGVGEVGGYTDWVIKWDVPDDIPGGELPKDPGATIGYFGFHSFQPPVTGYWGAKSDSKFDTGETQMPNCVPEPATMLLLGIGIFGFSTARKRL